MHCTHSCVTATIRKKDGQEQCCQILREKQAGGPMKTSPKQATCLAVVIEKKKRKKKKDHYTLHTHINITLNPEMYCIVSLHQ